MTATRKKKLVLETMLKRLAIAAAIVANLSANAGLSNFKLKKWQ